MASTPINVLVQVAFENYIANLKTRTTYHANARLKTLLKINFVHLGRKEILCVLKHTA
jgi:hypothetical protein